MSEGDDVDSVPAYRIVRDVATKGMDWLRNSKVLDYDSMMAFTTFAPYEDGWRRTNLQRLIEAKIISDKMVADSPTARPFRPIDALHPKEVEMWRAEMIDEFATALKVWSNDGAHWMPLYGFLYPRQSISFRAMNPLWFTKQLITPGRVAIIDGDLGSGKTAMGMLLPVILIRGWLDYQERGKDSDLYALAHELYAESEEDGGKSAAYDLLHSKGVRAISNVAVPNDDPYAKYFQYATRLSDMLIYLFENAIAGYFSVLVLDEMGMSYNRKRNMSRQNFGLEGTFRIIRKPSAVLIVITQNKELDLPDHMRRSDKGARTIIEKIKKTEAIITVHGVGQLSKQRVHNIPDAPVKYETRSQASLAVDIDPRILIEEVELMRQQAHAAGHEWTMEDQFKRMIEWCKARQNKQAMSEYKRQQVITLLQSLNPETGEMYTPEEVADEASVSDAFVAECQGVVAAVAENPSPQKGHLEEAILAMRHGILPQEISRLLGCSEEFVVAVLDKQKKAAQSPPKKIEPVLPPATPPPVPSPGVAVPTTPPPPPPPPVSAPSPAPASPPAPAPPALSAAPDDASPGESDGTDEPPREDTAN